jgi:hypothetical protein
LWSVKDPDYEAMLLRQQEEAQQRKLREEEEAAEAELLRCQTLAAAAGVTPHQYDCVRRSVLGDCAVDGRWSFGGSTTKEPLTGEQGLKLLKVMCDKPAGVKALADLICPE